MPGARSREQGKESSQGCQRLGVGIGFQSLLRFIAPYVWPVASRASKSHVTLSD